MRHLRRRLSITSLFTGATLVPLVVVGALLLYLAVRTTDQVSDALGQQVMAQTAHRVQASVRDYLHHAERTSDVFADLVQMGVLPLDQLERWRVPMLTHLRTTPEVASIGFANAADAYVYLMRFPPELEFGVGEATPDGTLMSASTAYLDGTIGPPPRRPVAFKVRERPWYRLAIASNGPTWTPAYTWFSRDVRPPGPEFSIAYTRTLHDGKTGDFLGVLSVDTLLTQVNTSLRELAEPLSGCLCITDDAGLLIGSSDVGPGAKSMLRPGRHIADIDSPIAQAVAREIDERGTAALRSAVRTPRLTVGGKTYWVRQSELSLGGSHHWYVTIAIPEQLILADAQRGFRWILTIGSAYIAIAILISILLGRLLARPMRRLSLFAQSVGEGDFDRAIDVGTTKEVADLSHSLNRMAASLRERVSLLAQRDAAEQATAAKSRLIAHVSHEFRTPLNSIIGYAELLRDQAEQAGRRADATDASNIRTASAHLLSLVENLLDLSAIEAGRLRLESIEFPIAALLDEVAIASRPVVERNGNRLDVIAPAADARMVADPTRVRQVLINLLSNAGRFTDEGQVTLAAEVDQAAGVVRFVVSDTGPGIPPEILPRLFEPFVHVPATAQTFPERAGAGLGLAISWHLCRTLGGDIRVQTSPAGTRVEVELPLGTSPKSAEAPAEASSGDQETVQAFSRGG